MNISVVMATFNGEKYLQEQLDTVLCQFGSDDELVISDDGSKDKTIEIIKDYQKKYSNIRLIDGPHKGVANNFTNAIKHSSGDIIFICDQDDLWNPNKVRTVKEVFEKHPKINVVMHDASFCGANGETVEIADVFEIRKARHGVLRNLLFSTYFGCCTAVRREYMMTLIPLPDYSLYDQYIGICAELDHCSYFLREHLIKHREHGDNWSGYQSLPSQIKIRKNLLRSLNEYKKRRIK